MILSMGGAAWPGKGAFVAGEGFVVGGERVAGGMHGGGGGHEWQGEGCMMGVCVTCTTHSRHYGYGIRSMSRWYAFYWNAFLVDYIWGLHSSGSRGRGEHALPPPGPVKLSHKKDERHRFHTQWRIQDFPNGGVATPKVDVLTYYFGRILHENERIFTSRGGTHLWRPP